MAKITISKNTCKGCGLCANSCPKKLIELSDTEMNDHGYFVAVFKDEKACVGCTLCAVMCPDCAIVVEK